jgi:hypothetical protein
MASILPSRALCRREVGLASVALTHPEPSRSVGLLWLRGAKRRVAALAFASIAEEVLESRASVMID